jgi:trans-2,3-dihydro-3-hydroxyanthranilate isomerase
MRYLHYDVFTDRRFEGNQLAVFPDAAGLAPDLMQVITREMNFSESTFILPAEAAGTDVRMRIFTPGAELPMAGHPTIGSTFALADLGVIAAGRDRFVFGLGVGPTPVELTWQDGRLSFAWMDQRPPESRVPAVPVADILTAIGVEADAWQATRLPVLEISCGVPFILVPLASRIDVDAADPNPSALRALKSAFGSAHVGVFLFSVEPDGSEVTAYSRMFAPGFGVVEDPATGSATGPLGAYLAVHDLVPRDSLHDMISLQGVKMRRPSRLHIRITMGDGDAVRRVQVGGRAVRVGEGTIET